MQQVHLVIAACEIPMVVQNRSMAIKRTGMDAAVAGAAAGQP